MIVNNKLASVVYPCCYPRSQIIMIVFIWFYILHYTKQCSDYKTSLQEGYFYLQNKCVSLVDQSVSSLLRQTINIYVCIYQSKHKKNKQHNKLQCFSANLKTVHVSFHEHQTTQARVFHFAYLFVEVVKTVPILSLVEGIQFSSMHHVLISQTD